MAVAILIFSPFLKFSYFRITYSFVSEDTFQIASSLVENPPPLRIRVVVRSEKRIKVNLLNCISGNSEGLWEIIMDRNYPPNPDYIIGDQYVDIESIRFLPTPKAEISTTDLLSTTEALVSQIQSLYPNVRFNLVFDSVCHVSPFQTWPFIGHADKIKIYETSLVPVEESFQSLLRPHQELYINNRGIKFTKPLNLKKIEIKSFDDYFDEDHFKFFTCKHLIVHAYNLTADLSVVFFEQWINGVNEMLRTFKLEQANKFFLLWKLNPLQYTGGKRVYEIDSKVIECSNGYDIMRKDGTVGTLNFTPNQEVSTKEDLIFVVWAGH
ncbi:unnamed protein product [Caenorhabditis brenneri]